MGMFDYVVDVPEVDCPKCGAKLNAWQSKDGPCDLEEIEYWKVENFYTNCHKCRTWVEFNREVPKEPVPLSAFTMSVEE